MSIFKAYDIRGKYPSELDKAKALAIGWATARFIRRHEKTAGAPKIAVGRDVRLSSKSLSDNLIRGLLAGGARVTDIGLATTPMSYFACGFYKFDGSVMVTASHNPPEYNGFKICRAKARALSENTGLREIEKSAGQFRNRGDNSGPSKATPKQLDITKDYKKFILARVKPLKGRIKIAVDFTNGSVGPIFDHIFKGLKGLSISGLYARPDGRFPNHEPNPMKDENIRALRRAVRKERADLGVAFDGDGDRVIFLDEQGRRIPNDLITALLAEEVLTDHPGGYVVYDLRSSRTVREQIAALGGRPVRERVGHAFIKATMRKHNAVFGGELSGHYYYRDNYFADSALLTFIHIINIANRKKQPISGLIKPLQKYAQSGELNFIVPDKEGKIAEIKRAFSGGRIDYLDGITVNYPDWWFNLRTSNTEPLLRLNIEAETPARLNSARRKIEKLIQTAPPGKKPIH